MSVNKNFVVKNGLEVNNNLIIADADRNKVGIGSTTPRTELDVRGGIAATDINISGVGTIVTLQSITGTVTNISGTNVNYSGIGTIGTVLASNANISGITTAGTLYVSGIATIAVGVVTNLGGTNLNYSGITTLGIISATNVTAQQLNVSGVSTFAGITTVTGTTLFSKQLSVSGVSTLGGNLNVNNSTTELSSIVNIRKAFAGNLTAQFDSGGTATLYYDGTQRLQTSSVGVVINGNLTAQANGNIFAGSLDLDSVSGASGNIKALTGISTLGITSTTSLTARQLNVSGISTIQNAVVSNLNVSGISTFGSISASNISGSNLNLSGITTLGNVKIASGIITAVSGVVTYYGDGSYLTGLAGSPTLQTVLNTGNTSTIGMSITGVSTLTTLTGTNLNYSGVGTITNIRGTSSNITGVSTAQDFDALSDINFKTDILTIDGSLNKVDKLRGVRFNWKESGLPSYGVIAQELEQVLPELVHGNNPKTVNYNGIIAVLIESIKELKEEIEELKKKLL